MERNIFEVQTSMGRITGTDHGDYLEFRGLRYASAARWQAPRLTEGWEGTWDGTRWKQKCLQFHLGAQDFYGKEFYDDDSWEAQEGEDCQFLNLYVPKQEREPGGFPVAVWYHGGGFINGWSHEKEFDGAGYARRGVILVTVNYRLGLFGFLCHPELTRRDGRSGNYGILDQIAALDWVRAHIGEFGGNADRISIFGQSAGAISVQTLVCAPLTNGKLCGVIMQSGNSCRGALRKTESMETMEQCAEEYFKKEGISLEDLIKMEEKQLFAYTDPYMRFMGERGLGYGPVVDGYVLTAGIDEVAEGGFLPDISYMAGCTENDMLLIGGEDGFENNRLYAANREWCQLLGEQGKKAYFYYFTRKLPGDDSGAFHACDLWYTFGTTNRCWRPLTEKDVELSERMMDCWCSFFKNGRPDEQEEWKTCEKDSLYVKTFDIC